MEYILSGNNLIIIDIQNQKFSFSNEFDINQIIKEISESIVLSELDINNIKSDIINFRQSKYRIKLKQLEIERSREEIDDVSKNLNSLNDYISKLKSEQKANNDKMLKAIIDFENIKETTKSYSVMLNCYMEQVIPIKRELDFKLQELETRLSCELTFE